MSNIAHIQLDITWSYMFKGSEWYLSVYLKKIKNI